MDETSPTINDLSKRAGELARMMSARAGLPPHSPMMFGMASGFDIAITLLEQSTGVNFGGLTPESATRVVQYFRDEAARSASVDPQVALVYQSWADTLTATYIALASRLERRSLTTINQAAAQRRFEQGLRSLRASRQEGHDALDSESQLAVAALMAYLGAYAFPGGNLYDFKQIFSETLRPDFPAEQLEPFVDKAIGIAELFRRPWEEPGDPQGPTI